MVEDEWRLRSSLGASEAGLEVRVQTCLFPGCAGQRRGTCSPSLSLFVNFVVAEPSQAGMWGAGMVLGRKRSEVR